MMARWLATLVVAAAMAWPSAASAHRSAARELVIQLDSRGAVALWHLRLVGPEALLMAAVWDRDRNGVLDEGERVGAAVALLSRALRGVTLTWDGQLLRAADLEPRLDGVGERSLAAVGLVSLRIPDATAGTHVLRIEVDAKSGPLAFQIQTLDSWRPTDVDTELAPDGRGLAQPLVVAPGRATEIKVTVGGAP